MPRRAGLFAVVVFVVVILFPYSTFAQHGEPFDASKCFPKILQDTRTDYTHKQLKYALLSTWSRETYQDAKASGSITSLLPKLPIGASFEASNEARLKEMASNNESLDFDQITATSAAWLDPQAGAIIKECLDDQVRSGYGLSSVVFVDNERDVTLMLYWNWSPGGTPVLIKTKLIENAVVTDDSGKHPKQLLPPHMVFSDWGKLSYSAPISIRRTNLDKDIVINIETDPDVGAQHIVIPKVPLKQNCVEAKETTDKFGTPYTHVESKYFEQLQLVRDDGNGHKFVDYNVDIAKVKDGTDGVIDAVGCRKSSNTLYAEVSNPVGDFSGTVATCHGWFQNLGSQMELRVNWYKTGYACTPIPWAVEPQTKK